MRDIVSRVIIYRNQGMRAYVLLFSRLFFVFDKRKGVCFGTSFFDKEIAYFKVNRCEEENIRCVQHWVDVIKRMNYGIVLVCDKANVRRNIIKHVNFYDVPFCVKRSRMPYLNKYVESIYTDYWKNATYAHLIPFFFASKKNRCHWDIDADDTYICHDAAVVAKALLNVELIAHKGEMDIVSIDMWHSRTNGNHWSFGVAFVANNCKILKCIKTLTDNRWRSCVCDLDDSINIDWYMTYLNNYKYIKAETFFLDETIFIHWGKPLLHPIYSGLIVWHNNTVLFPFIYYFANDKQNGCKEIKGMIRVKTTCSIEESENHLKEKVMDYMRLSRKRMRLYEIKEEII